MAVIGSLVAQLSLDAAAFIRDLNKAGNTLDQAGRRMAGVGRNISTYISTPLVGLGALVIKTSSDFEAGMNKLESVSGATGAELGKLREEAKKLGSQVEFGKFSALDAAQGMTDLAQAGFKTNEIITAMPGLLQLATASQMDLAAAADTVSSILRGYNKPVEDLAHVNDVLTKASIATNAELRSLGEAMKFVGPVATAAGLGFEEVTAAIGRMSDAGIQGEMAGTALRGAITQILSPSEAAAAKMGELGIKLVDSAGKIRPLVEILEELAPHAEDAGLFMELFGQRAGPAMAALVLQGSDSLASLTAELENSGGTAAKVASTQLKGFGAAIEGLRSSFEGLLIASGEAGLLQFATDAVKGVTKFVEALSQLDPATLKFAAILAAAVAAGGPLLLLLGGAAVAIGALLSPIGLVVAAIVGTAGLIGAIVAFREEIGRSLIRAVDTSVSKFIYMKNAVLAAVQEMVNGVNEWMNARLQGAFDGLQMRVQGVIDAFQFMKDIIVGNSIVPDMVMEIQGWMERLEPAMVGPASRAVEQTMREFEQLAVPADMFRDSIEELEREQHRAADRASELAAQPFENALRSVQSEFSNTFEEIFSGGVTSFEDLADSAKSIFTRLAAELATLAIFQPGAMFGGAAGTSAPGGLGGGLLGGFAGPLLAGGLGVVGGGLIGNFFGGKGQIGGTVGGGLGAALGFGIGGPIGGLIGGLGGSLLGGGIGSLFGGGGPTGSKLTFGRGELGSIGLGGTNEASGFIRQLDQSILEIIDVRTEKIANRFLQDADNVSVLFGDEGPSANDLSRLAAARIGPTARALGFREQGIVGLPQQFTPEQQLQNLQAAIQLQKTIEDITGAVTPFQRALQDLREHFANLEAQARKFGISTKGLGNALKEAERQLHQQRDFERQSLTLQLRQYIAAGSAGGALAVQIAGIRLQFAQLRIQAEELGISLVLVDKAMQAAIDGAQEAAREARRADADQKRFARQAEADRRRSDRQAAAEDRRQRRQQAAAERIQRREDRRDAIDLFHDLTAPNDYRREIDAINERYGEATRLARQYGLDEDKLNDARREAIRLVNQQRQDEIDQLALSVVEPFREITSGLENFSRELELSLLDPVALFHRAKEDFESIAKLAAGGNLAAIDQLDEAGRFFIEQAGRFGAAPAQADAIRQVQDATARVTREVGEAQRDAVRGLTDEVRAASRREVDTLREVVTEVRRVADEIKRLRRI